MAFAQPVIISGPVYCCYSIGEISQPLTAGGGNGAYAWSLVGGSLPPGLALRTDVPSSFPAGASAGLIGVATTPGTYNFTLQVTSNGQSSTQVASMHVSALVLKDPWGIPDGFVNVAYPSYQLSALNAQGPVNYTLNGGSLPPGMSLSTSGLISGTPSTPGTYNSFVCFADGTDSSCRGIGIAVYAMQITTPGVLPNATQNSAYNQTVTASGGTPPYNLTASSLPSGLTLTSSGTISGTVTARLGRYPFSLTVTDAKGASYTKQMSLTVLGGPQFPLIALPGIGNFNDCTVGVVCTPNGSASGGVPPYDWSAAGLPPGMSIRYGSGITTDYVVPGDFELWGTPTALGTYNVSLTVTDATGAATTGVFPLEVSALIVDPADYMPNGVIGVSYSHKLRVLGGTGSYSVSLAGGSLPDGLSLNAEQLLVSGTPLENGGFATAFRFTDTASNGLQITNQYSISGGSSTTVIYADSNLGYWTVGTSPNFSPFACCASAYTWSVVGGSLPPGLTLSPSGVLSGTLTEAGSYTFLLSAADTSIASNIGFKQFVITVTPIALAAATDLPYGNIGVASNQPLTAAHGSGPLTWTLAPLSHLPPGLNLAPTGDISGMPTATGRFQFNAVVTDAAGNTGIWTFNISVFPAAVTAYAAPNGNDANSGTLDQPFRTLRKCATAAYGGSTCFVRAGVYRETVVPNSGITILPWNGESVTVDGADPITGWTLYAGSIYQAPAVLNPDDTNQLFVGGQMMTEARWPNGDDLFHVNWAITESGTDDLHLFDSHLPNIDWTGAKVLLLSGPDPWCPQTATVTASSQGLLTISLETPDSSPDIVPQAGGFYYLYRSLAALDKQGEWFYDPGKSVLYFWPPGNLNPNTLDVRAKRRRLAFDLSGRSNVTIRGISIFGSGINMDEYSGNNVLDGINAQFLSHFTDFPAANGDPSFSWILHTTDSGIVLNGPGNTLRNSTIAWSAGNGVSLLGTGSTLRNNLIVETGYAGNFAGGVNVAGSGHTLRNNTIQTVGRSALTIASGPEPLNDDIGYNNIFNAMMLGPDGGEIDSYGVNAVGTRIHHNWLHDTQTPFPVSPGYPRSGMYLDTGSNSFEIDQNVIWNNQYLNMNLTAGSGSGIDFVHNNSIPDVSPDGVISFGLTENCAAMVIQDNLTLLFLQQPSNVVCPAVDNDATAPGATDMTAAVEVGCNFAGCSSASPPAISGTSVGPSVAVQPLSAIVASGQTATFTVIAAGSPTITYQWQRNGVDIAGATTASYTTPPTSFADNGAQFSVRITNSVASAMSNSAILSIGATPLLVPAITRIGTGAMRALPSYFTADALIEPGAWFSISGTALAPFGDARAWQPSDFNNNVAPVQLDGVCVIINGKPAVLRYISPSMIEALAPSDLPSGDVAVTVTNAGLTSPPVTVSVRSQSPRRRGVPE